MKEIMAILGKCSGYYEGQGINHEGEVFTGKLQIRSLLENRGFSLRFSAVGKDGTIYHQEESTIAPSIGEKLTLWNLNTNTPGLVPHELRPENTKVGSIRTFTFGFNDPSDAKAFREEIALDVHDNGDLSYTYSWGLPNGEFKERSGVRMKMQTPDPNKIEFLSAALLISKDAKRLADFYREVIGVPLEDEKHGETDLHYGCELGDLHFAIHPLENFKGTGHGTGSVKLAFTVFDMNSFVERVKSRGVKLEYEPKNLGFANMTALYDPDGNYLEFTELSDRWFKHLENQRSSGFDVIERWKQSKLGRPL